MPIVLALVSALAYGVSDYLAGLAARRQPAVRVAIVATLGATAITLAGALAVSAEAIEPSDLAWGAASGLGSAFGGVMLYRGLGRGRMSVVAPISALGAAVLPIVVGVIGGDRPSAIAWVGVALALPAIWLVSQPVEDDGGTDPASATVPRGRWDSDVIDGLLAGAGFGLLFIGLDQAGDAAGLWPVVSGELAAIALLAVATLVRGGAVAGSWDRGAVGLAVVAGLVGGIAATAYFLATHGGMLSIVAVLTSLYPAVTVVLAAMLLHEPVGRRQLAGLVAAALAIGCIVIG